MDTERDHNLHPHAEAIFAMTMWGAEYARQRLGCMDWWDALDYRRKTLVRETLDRMSALPREKVAQ